MVALRRKAFTVTTGKVSSAGRGGGLRSIRIMSSAECRLLELESLRLLPRERQLSGSEIDFLVGAMDHYNRIDLSQDALQDRI